MDNLIRVRSVYHPRRSHSQDGMEAGTRAAKKAIDGMQDLTPQYQLDGRRQGESLSSMIRVVASTRLRSGPAWIGRGWDGGCLLG